ncbi:unnamed protein product, partial [Laminaria digitata]
MKLTYKIACCMMCCLLFAGSAFAQQKRSAAENSALKARYGANYEEIVQKHGQDPEKLQQAAAKHVEEQNMRPFFFSRDLDSPYVVRGEAEPNDFFDTADEINDVLATAGWRGDGEFTGGLIMGTFSGADFDVYKFTVDTTKMYYFGGTHSFLGDVNTDDGDLGVNLSLFHESDLDTTFVEGFNGIEGNDQVSGDIQGETTNHR